MNNKDRRDSLVARIEVILNIEEEFARGKDDSLKTKDQAQQRRKCGVCGKAYLGQQNSSSCSSTCRSKKSRG